MKPQTKIEILIFLVVLVAFICILNTKEKETRKVDEHWLSTDPNTKVVVHEHLGDVDEGDSEYWKRIKYVDGTGKVHTMDLDVRGHVLRIDDETPPVYQSEGK